MFGAREEIIDFNKADRGINDQADGKRCTDRCKMVILTEILPTLRSDIPKRNDTRLFCNNYIGWSCDKLGAQLHLVAGYQVLVS